MDALTGSWAVAFVWTCALELPVYTLFLGRRFERWWAVCWLCLVLNITTHPALWSLFPRFEPAWFWLAVAEAVVTAVEAALVSVCLLRSMPPRKAIALGFYSSLAANALSAGVGCLWSALG
jgi:hypothetical protein